MTQPPFQPPPPQGQPAPLAPPAAAYPHAPAPAPPHGYPHDQAPPGYVPAGTGYPPTPAPGAPHYATTAPAPNQPLPDLLHGEQTAAPPPPFVEARKTGSISRRDRRMILAIAFIVGAAATWKLLPREKPVTPTPAASHSLLPPTHPDWQAAVPKTRPTETNDANTLTAREVAPKRFAHQLALVTRQMGADEWLRLIQVQGDGSVRAIGVSAVGDVTTARWITSKKPQTPLPVPTPASYNLLNPTVLTDINTRTPAKLLRVIARAHGLAPGLLILQTPTAGAFGANATWLVKWPGAVGTVYASADAHHLRR